MSVTLNRREVLKAAFAMSAVPLAVQSAWAARLLRGVRGGAVSVTYGATADQGETDDPLVDATAYAAGTIYAEGAIVSTAGSAPYYYSRSSGNVGNLLSNNTYWMQISNFLYVDDVSGSDANTYNSDPTTAFNNPVQTLNRVTDMLFATGSPNAVNAPAKTLILFKRGGIFYGALAVQVECIIGAYGTRASPRPELRFRLSSNTSLSFAGLLVDIQSGGTGSIVRNLRLNSQYAYCTGITTGTGSLAIGDRVWRQTTHTYPATVISAINSNRVTLAFDTNTDANNGSTPTSGMVFETQDGAKTFTIGPSVNPTQVSGIAASTTGCRILNCEVFSAIGNGIGAGTTNVRNSASNFYVYNCIVHDTCKWGGAGAGMQGGWGDGIKILHCTAYDNGQQNIFSHNFYLDDLDNVEFAYNWCYMTAAFGNHGLVVHGQCTGGSIHDNLFEYCQSGIGINDGYSTIAASGWYEEFNGITVERNIIRHCGTYNGTGLVLDIAANINCTYRNNIAYNNKGVIDITENKHTADKAFTSGLLMEFNTFISDTTVGAGDYFWKLHSNNGSVGPVGSIIRNNIIESQRTAVPTFSTDAVTGAANCTFSNNLIYNITGYSNIIRWGGTVYTLSAWAATGGINSNSTNVTTSNYASVFTNKASWDLTLPGGSPAKGIGIPGSVGSDFRQAVRSGAIPSAGGYE